MAFTPAGKMLICPVSRSNAWGKTYLPCPKCLKPWFSLWDLVLGPSKSNKGEEFIMYHL